MYPYEYGLTQSNSFYNKFYSKPAENFKKEKTCKLGDVFYTSIDVTIKYLLDHDYKNIYVLGVKSFKNELKKHFNLYFPVKKLSNLPNIIAPILPMLFIKLGDIN